MIICFSCTYTSMIWYFLQGKFSANEGTAYSIIMSHDHFHNSPQLYPCNDIAWEQAPEWGKKAKNEVK